MQQGIAKGKLKRADEANLHLGIAYLRAGQKAKAQQAFKSVGGTDGTADLARPMDARGLNSIEVVPKKPAGRRVLVVLTNFEELVRSAQQRGTRPRGSVKRGHTALERRTAVAGGGSHQTGS